MKKPIITVLSLIFMFGLTIFGLLLLNIYFFNWPLIGFGIFHLLAIIWAFIVLADKKRRFETRIRWFCFIVCIPIIGVLSYLFFGRSYKYKITKNYKFLEIKNKHSENELEQIDQILTNQIPQFKRAFKTASISQTNNIFLNTKVEFLENGNQLFLNLFKDIKNAKHYILLNFYIFKDGKLLDELTNLLIKKLKENVKVYIIYDFAGSYTLFEEAKIKLLEYGCQIVCYAPIRFPFIKWTANYRDHRKDIIIDNKIGYIGGINIGDEYINLDNKFGYWNDCSLKITGNAVSEIQRIFISDYDFYKPSFKKNSIKQDLDLDNVYSVKCKDQLVQIVSSGPNHEEPLHLSIFINLINSAQKRIWISTPYFIPPQEIRTALINAANSKLDVRILIPGLTDKAFLLDQTKQWTRELYKAGVKIYSINNVFNHNKTYLFDDEITFIGSTNLDFRALFADQQTMGLIYSKSLNKTISNKFEQDFKNSYLYDHLPNKNINWFRKIVIKIYNIIQPLL
ncbi:cardiolipin synthase [Mycoplasma mycoides]|uniref:cardiolipin synthase n=1 Tax=Mycoplasma mycoides TaxID=2102 RepID=UPI0027341270|nr:cardiolipin synthase [Mycoplasma mycoides]MDP4040639.1 cardiolipin synthase [Mycoplasma mycoides]MDP4041462.1 cardiolipin synthase [Mycoplasma mycoides]MDP4042400.1 cardiolipin synthase [Mycoplasma mycoides]MDP4043802.1 cardiolipin synthase [Mycoplasma mycoides]MDP4044709.1 cardiolipin synthase [Mycoplasma mycoides]